MSQVSIQSAAPISFPCVQFRSASLRQAGLYLLSRRWPWRVAAILLLFVIQGLWLTVRFDTGAIAQSSGAWASFFQILPTVPRIGICLFVSVPLLGRKRLAQWASSFARAVESYHGWSLWWACQWMAFAILTTASSHLFESERAASSEQSVWTVVWIVSAIACCGTCLCAVAPPRFWTDFLRREHRLLFAGLATSLIATSGGRLFQKLWNPLGDLTFRMVAWLLSFIYSGTVVSDVENRFLGTESFYVQIAPQCSGYEGIGLISVFLLIFLFTFRQVLRFPRAWLLLPAGILLIWICNSIRITALIVIGTEYSPSLAMGGFHSQAGWILFNMVSIGLMAGSLKSDFFTRSTAKIAARKTGAAVPYLVPFLALTALSMAIPAFVDDPAAFYPVTVAVSVAALWSSRDLLRRLNWSWSSEAMLTGVGVYLIWTALAWIDWRSRGSIAVSVPDQTTIAGMVWTVLRVFGSVVTVPIIEELAFRGFFLRRLTRSGFEGVEYRNASTWAIVVSSLAFGVSHQLWIGGIIAGFAYAWVTRRRNNLTDAIQSHAVTNGLIALTVLTTGATWLW